MRNWLDKIVNDTVTRSSDGLEYMREKSFNYIAVITLGIGLIALSVSLVESVKDNSVILIVIDLVSYLFVAFIALGKKIIPQRIRIYSFVYLSLILGISFMLIEGPKGAGIMYLVVFNLLSAVFVGLNATFLSILITMVVWGMMAIIIQFDLLPGSPIHDYKILQFFLTGINLIMISSVSFVLNLLVANLDKTVRHKERLRKLLHDNIERLSEAKKKAEESDMLKSLFLANVSHEIRTPMNAILGFSDLALNQDDMTEEEIRYYIRTIYDSGQYLMNVIDNILDVSLLDTNQLKIYKGDVSITKVFSDLKVFFGLIMKGHNNVELKFDINDKISSVKIFTDEHRLKQVLINLINNALKFTAEGDVTVGANILSGEIEIFVKDTGEGINEADMNRIFERFVKANQSETITKKKGAGLGLSISKGIVEILGGKITVESEQGKGTTFYFTLPLKKK